MMMMTMRMMSRGYPLFKIDHEDNIRRKQRGKAPDVNVTYHYQAKNELNEF
jgi:hypothetical protein